MSKEKDKLISKVSKIWGGRFKKNNSKLMRDFNASIEFDKRLCFHDLEPSRVHSNMLANKKIITLSSDENKITFISSDNNIQYKKKSKDQVSKDIFEQIIKRCLKK